MWVGCPHHGLLLSGGPGTVDRERGFNAGGPRPVLRAAEDTGWPHPELHHPPDLPLHLREQAHGHNCSGKWLRVSSSVFVHLLLTQRETHKTFALSCAVLPG